MRLVAVAGGVGDAADDRAGDAEEPAGEGDGEALHLLGTRLREERLAKPDVFRARGGGGDGEEEALSWQIAPIGHGARQHVADARATVTRVAVARVAVTPVTGPLPPAERGGGNEGGAGADADAVAGYRLEERGCPEREPVIEPPGDADENYPLRPQARDQLRGAGRGRCNPEATQLHGRIGRGKRRQTRHQARR